MKKILLKILRVRYFLSVLLLGTILFLIFNPNYLYDRGEYFKTDYKRYFSSDHFSFLPENPFYDIINLTADDKAVTLYYRNFNTEAVKQIELPGYSVNPELGGEFNDFYYDKEDKTIHIILTTNGSDYYFVELYNPDNKFEVNAQKIFRHDLYDELQSKWIRIKKTQFFPSKLENQSGKSCITKAFEDGYKVSFNIETLKKLRKVPINEIENDVLYLFICDKMQNSIGIEYIPADVFEIIQFLFRNSYYKKMVFSKNGINNKGFLGAKIVGRIDSNNDGKKEYLIHIKGKRWINELLICYDEEKRQIIWKKEIIYGISDNIKIYDIDKDGIEEILFSTIAYCNEFPIDWFRKKEVGESYYSYFYILDNNGKIKIINNKPAVVKSECGLYKFHYLPLFKQDKVLLAFSSSSEKIEKRIMVYDLKKNEIKELEISYNNITNFYFEDKNIIAIDNYKRRLSKIIISKDLKLKKIFITNSPYNIGDYPPNRIIIDNKKYSMLTIPVLIVDDKLNTLYKSPYQISCSSIHLNNNKIYFKELDKNKTYLSSLTFFRNKKLNPYIIIILLVEILLLISYLFIFQIIKIPLNTGTSSYFVLYTIFGRFYYWQLHGRLKNIYKLPKNVALSKEIPEKIFRDIAEEIKIVFERSFLLFKYKVYEILSHDEFQIIQRISHDLKNQVLLTKLELEQFEKESTKLLSKNKSDSFFKNMNSSFKEISNAAAILSSFSHIKKLYKEQIDMKDYIEFMLSKYLNHPYYDNIEIEFKNTISALSLDKNLMEICFRNLLNNALETIIEKDKIKIEVSEIHETVIIEIKNPCSIPPCDHEKFYQIGFSTKDTGSGLGIPISKTIIEKHDGTLSINCENNEFIVTILLPKINEL